MYEKQSRLVFLGSMRFLFQSGRFCLRDINLYTASERQVCGKSDTFQHPTFVEITHLLEAWRQIGEPIALCFYTAHY